VSINGLAATVYDPTESLLVNNINKNQLVQECPMKTAYRFRMTISFVMPGIMLAIALLLNGCGGGSGNNNTGNNNNQNSTECVLGSSRIGECKV